MRRIAQWSVLLVLAVLCAAVLFTPAVAEGSGKTYTEWKDELLSLRRFTFQRHKEGIGLGDCPVYTAPSKDALRMANGRAAVDTNKDFYEGGKTEEGWLLIRYRGLILGWGKGSGGIIRNHYPKGLRGTRYLP